MIDNVAIYVSCICVIIVAWRAALLDSERPWFKPFHGKRVFGATAGPEKPVWRR